MTLFTDDIRAREDCNGTSTFFSHVVMALQPSDRIPTQCDKLEIEQYTQKCTESGLYYNKAVSIVKTC